MNIQDFYEEGSKNLYPKFLFFKYDEFADFINNSDKKELSSLLEINIPFVDEDLKNSIDTIQPKNINELSVALALASPFKKDFLKIIKNKKLKLSLHRIENKEIRSIVENTFYIIVFRQQTLKILQIIWQCDEKEAKVIRKEFVKKSNTTNLYKTFVEKALKINLTLDDAIFLYRKISLFSYVNSDQNVAKDYANKIYDISKLLLEKTEKFGISNEHTEFIKNLVSNINAQN